MSLDALGLALGSAVLHAVWNLMLGRERDTTAATAVGLGVAVLAFAPVAALRWDVDASAWPYIAAAAALQLVYFGLLGAAYRRADVSVVYPVARGTAPVIVLLLSVTLLGAHVSAGQAVGVVVIGVGVALVCGFSGGATAGVLLGLAVASCIAGYTLVDNSGVERADPLVYLELTMFPVAVAYLGVVAAGSGAWDRLRAAARPGPALVGLLSFLAYGLVLAALVRAPAAPVAAVRETSVVVAALLAAPLLGERVGPGRLLGAALVAVGVALVASA